MFLFRKQKILYFIHIYKTGGTTLNNLLHNNYKNNEIHDLYVPYLNISKSTEVYKVYKDLIIEKDCKIIYGHYSFGIHEKFPKLPYSYLCFVREPFSRIVSTYFHLKRMDIKWQFKILNKLDEHYKSESDVLSKFPDINTYLNYEDLQNQICMFLTGISPKIIATNQEYYAKIAIKNIEEHFCFVGLMEDFEDSLKRLQDILKLKTIDYSYKNLGVNKPQVIIYENETLNTFKGKNQADYKIFNYVKSRFYSKSVI